MYRYERITWNEEDDNIWGLKNDKRSLPLIRVLGWKDSHSTSIEISLPIILHLYFMWSAFLYSLKKFVCIPFRNLDFYLRDLDQSKHFIQSRWASLEEHMIKFDTSDLFFIILISLYPTDRPARLEECFEKRLASRWFWSKAAIVPARSILPSLFLTPLHLPSQSFPSSPIEP